MTLFLSVVFLRFVLVDHDFLAFAVFNDFCVDGSAFNNRCSHLDVCAFAGCLLLIVLARRRNGSLGLSRIVRPVSLSLAAAVFMALALAFVRPLVASLPSIVALAVLIFLGVALYGAFSVALMPDQIGALLGRFRRKMV